MWKQFQKVDTICPTLGSLLAAHVTREPRRTWLLKICLLLSLVLLNGYCKCVGWASQRWYRNGRNTLQKMSSWSTQVCPIMQIYNTPLQHYVRHWEISKCKAQPYRQGASLLGKERFKHHNSSRTCCGNWNSCPRYCSAKSYVDADKIQQTWKWDYGNQGRPLGGKKAPPHRKKLRLCWLPGRKDLFVLSQGKEIYCWSKYKYNEYKNNNSCEITNLLLCSRNYANKHLIYIPTGMMLSAPAPLHLWENWGPERLNNVSKVTQLEFKFRQHNCRALTPKLGVVNGLELGPELCVCVYVLTRVCVSKFT